jgi:hypothetical protein
MTQKKDELLNHGVNEVVADLQKEHTRWQERLARVPVVPVGAPDEIRFLFQRRAIEATIEYIELLIRRYRSWL